MSFELPVTAFDADPFPSMSEIPMLTPYWGDVDTSGTGEVWYQQTNDSDLLIMARSDVLTGYPAFDFFTPTSLLIATWDHVGYYENGIDLVFLLIIIAFV